jgi:uncharacterized protein
MPEVTPGGTTTGGHAISKAPIGFGCYRVDDETAEHRRALERALDLGCGLIDTSTNYTDGASERLVGLVLEALARRSPAARGPIRVVTKIGYVQGTNLTLAAERERAGRPFPEMVRYMDGCWHCIHPEFLRDQLARSRARLKVDRVDAVLLHNPEYFLSDALHRDEARHRGASGLEAARTEFYRRLREAFAFLEERAAAGEIGAYGVSSNTCVGPRDDFESTSVARMLDAARAAGGQGHRFRVLQLPMNLFETGGALERNTGPDAQRTALEEAAAAGLEVLVNRPLNAFARRHLIRLANDMPATEAVSAEIDPHLPEERRAESLSRKAIWVLSSLPGVATILVGMRRTSYVEDAMAVAAWPPHPDPLAVLRHFSRLVPA